MRSDGFLAAAMTVGALRRESNDTSVPASTVLAPTIVTPAAPHKVGEGLRERGPVALADLCSAHHKPRLAKAIQVISPSQALQGRYPGRLSCRRCISAALEA